MVNGNKKNGELFSIFGIIILAIVSLSSVLYDSGSNDVVSDSIKYSADVCRTVIRADGSIEPTECNHNLIYNDGKDAIKNSIGTGGEVGAFTTISLCNATLGCGTIVVDHSEDFNTYGACGMEAGAGAFASGGSGNWSISKTFTSTCDDIEVNATRLINSTYGNFSGSAFTLATLQTNDQIQINWSISVTN